MTSPIYKIVVNDRNYTNWSILSVIDFKEIEMKDLEPIKHKLLSNDVFSIDENEPTIIHSGIRNSIIPGVLLLKDNKTFGRHKNGKLLYKCYPDDKRLPGFLIPYDIKNAGFSKVFSNHYITFQFSDWTDKHPYGTIMQTIGSVDELFHYYEYQLYCKSLNSSIQKFTKETSSSLKMHSQSQNQLIDTISNKYAFEDRTSWNIFSIDPANSLDFDDAFSLQVLDQDKIQLSIYISNVTIWIDILQLWESFSKRISTIYLPDRKRPMLPTILSDCLCSLQADQIRFAFTMDLFIVKDTIVDIKYSNCKIKLSKNYVYEESALFKNNDYQMILQHVKVLSKKYKYLTNIKDSHDVVAYLMIMMNYQTAKKMLEFKNGIFRSTVMKTDQNVVNHDLPEDVEKFIKIWNSAVGQYVMYKEGEQFNHVILEVDAYIHITSPIRRLVDLLNIIQIQKNLGLIELSEKATCFYNNWLNELEYINSTMRSIRKIQNDCSLLHSCTSNPEIMDKIYDGFIFVKLVRNDCLFQYIVYLPSLKLTSKITLRENIELYEKKAFKLYLFQDEDNLKKKIRLHFLN